MKTDATARGMGKNRNKFSTLKFQCLIINVFMYSSIHSLYNYKSVTVSTVNRVNRDSTALQ